MQSPPDGLGRVATEIRPGLKLVGPGNTPFPQHDPPDVILRQLDTFPGSVIVDAGLIVGECRRSALGLWFAAHSTRSLLVTQACYLALSRAASSPLTPSGVIVIAQQGRALAAADIEAATRAPVIAEIAHDMAIARAVDAGLLLNRFPRGLRRAMRDVA